MFRCPRAVVPVAVAAFMVFGAAAVAQPAGGYAGIGRAATPSELAAWDIDVRPDFKGLPKGVGTVAQGQDIWEAKCASCHGVFGEANNVFHPLIGGTTAKDIQTGNVARLKDMAYPQRTTLMKLPTLSTLWDYIARAMPWNEPKSLTTNEVYAVTAFMLNLGGVVPDNFTLSDANMREVQGRLPNRNGMTTAHALWPGDEFAAKPGQKSTPDIKAKACMSNCAATATVTSQLPDFARNAHGNLADQNRLVGAQRGAETEVRNDQAAVAKVDSAAGDGKAVMALLNQYSCTACHGMTQKLVGPSFQDIATKQANKVDYLSGKIKAGGAGVWGVIPMPPQGVSEAEARVIATWLAAGAPR